MKYGCNSGSVTAGKDRQPIKTYGESRMKVEELKSIIGEHLFSLLSAIPAVRIDKPIGRVFRPE